MCLSLERALFRECSSLAQTPVRYRRSYRGAPTKRGSYTRRYASNPTYELELSGCRAG